MKFSEREEILEQRQIRKEMYTRHLTKFAGTTAIAVILFLQFIFPLIVPLLSVSGVSTSARIVVYVYIIIIII